MAQTGFTPIQLYKSATASAAPVAANLLDGELAINTNDGRLFYKDSSGVVQTIAWKTTPVSAGGSGATSQTAYAVLCGGTTPTGAFQSVASVGTAGQVLTSNGPGALPSFQSVSGGVTSFNTRTGAVTLSSSDVTTALGFTPYNSTNPSGYITSAGRAYPRRSDGGDLNFFWSGQSGQPSWLWGGNDGNNMYVYNPSNFSVNYANSAGSASSVSTAAVLNGTAGASAGAVGTYAFLGDTTARDLDAGNTLAGSGLRYTNGDGLYGGGGLPGTWRLMGKLRSDWSTAGGSTLWLRIS